MTPQFVCLFVLSERRADSDCLQVWVRRRARCVVSTPSPALTSTRAPARRRRRRETTTAAIRITITERCPWDCWGRPTPPQGRTVRGNHQQRLSQITKCSTRLLPLMTPAVTRPSLRTSQVNKHKLNPENPFQTLSVLEPELASQTPSGFPNLPSCRRPRSSPG